MSNRRTRTRRNSKKRLGFNFDFDFDFDLKFKISKKAIIIPIITIILILTICSIMFVIINMGNNKILNNVYIKGIDVSKLTKEEAKEKIEKELVSKLENTVLAEYGEYSIEILPEEIGFEYDVKTVVEEAYLYGRTGNIFSNNITILKSNFNDANLDIEYSYNGEKMDKVLENISLEIPNVVQFPSYYIADNKLIITKGVAGNKLNIAKTKEDILNAIENHTNNIKLIVEETQAEKIDIEKIYEEIHTEPQNASVTKEPFSVTVEKNGIDFAIAIDKAKEIISNEELNEYTIPLKFTKPKIKVADLGEDIFGNTLSKFETKYDVTNTNRSTNLELALKKINGTILQPGEIFSFNKVLGERTLANGYKNAAIYSDGELEYGVGGGICQISSTLYNSVVFANLEIVERKNHSMTVNYVDIGRDATVSYGSIDFKFKNSRNYPIKIVATSKSGIATISIKGIMEENEYDVEIVTEILDKVDFKTKYETVNTLISGAEFTKQTGKYGYKVETYKVLSKGGKEISKILLSTDTYKPQVEIIQKGR